MLLFSAFHKSHVGTPRHGGVGGPLEDGPPVGELLRQGEAGPGAHGLETITAGSR